MNRSKDKYIYIELGNESISILSYLFLVHLVKVHEAQFFCCRLCHTRTMINLWLSEWMSSGCLTSGSIQNEAPMLILVLSSLEWPQKRLQQCKARLLVWSGAGSLQWTEDHCCDLTGLGFTCFYNDNRLTNIYWVQSLPSVFVRYTFERWPTAIEFVPPSTERYSALLPTSNFLTEKFSQALSIHLWARQMS